MDTFTLTHNGTSTEYPLSEVEALLDRVLSAAWRAARFKIPLNVDFHEQVIPIPVTQFEYPIEEKPERIIGHLHYFGIMKDYNPEIKTQWRKSLEKMTPSVMKEYEAKAKERGLLIYQEVYAQKMHIRFKTRGNNGGGRKSEAGSTIATCIKPYVRENLEYHAAVNAETLSKYVSKILTDWVQEHPISACKEL